MDNSTFKQNIGKLASQRNCFLVFSLALSVVVVLLSVLLFFKSERTVIVPTSGPEFWIENNRVSEVYLEKVGLFLSDLLLNRTPSDVEKKNRVILEYVHPAFYQEIKRTLNQEKEALLKGQQSVFFKAENSYADGSKDRFVTEGEFLILVGKGGEAPFCAQNERKRFILQFHCQNGRLLLTSLKKESI